MFIIPNSIASLYKHWDYYTCKPEYREAFQGDDLKLYDEILWFAKERMSIWEKKQNNSNPPFTQDHILASYRFCNIVRELDRQTIEYHTMIRPEHMSFEKWVYNMICARIIARPETLETIGLFSFDIQENKKIHDHLCSLPRPRYGTPYVFPISILLHQGILSREEFMCSILPLFIPIISDCIQNQKRSSLTRALDAILGKVPWKFKFLFTEVLIDVGYQFPQYINLDDDIYIGPGAIPTLENFRDPASPQAILKKLTSHLARDIQSIVSEKRIYLTRENVEGICCEFRKYMHLKQGTGRKRIYKNK